MIYKQVKNPKWVNVDKTIIECEVIFEHLGDEFFPFGASQNDIYEHTREIFERCVAGKFGPVADYVEPEPVPVIAAPSNQQPESTGAQTL